MEDTEHYRKAGFAAGSFWDAEAVFRQIRGVVETVTGYTGGTTTDPTYEQVRSGTTGHAEAVGIVFDPNIVCYEKLLEIFWDCHDPTLPNRDGTNPSADCRSVIFYHTDEQEREAILSRDQLAASGTWGIVRSSRKLFLLPGSGLPKSTTSSTMRNVAGVTGRALRSGTDRIPPGR
jgi:methionine-S-sulfoxide reductase